MLENKFQAKLIESIKEKIPGCIVLKNDCNYIQGFPDLTILHNNGWAVLECKKDKEAPRQPNQEYYIRLLSDMGYAKFIFPENEEEILNELQYTFGV